MEEIKYHALTANEMDIKLLALLLASECKKKKSAS